MKKICPSILLMGIAILTAACPKTTPIKPQVLDKAANYQIAQLDNNIASYECAAYGTTVIVNGTSITEAKCPAGNVIDFNKARQVRNATIHSLIRITDYNYFQFENDLYVRRATGSFLADATDIGANLAATITNGARVKTIINASLIAFRGGRKSASIHYFQEQTADVLIIKMQTARNRVLADILKQLRDNDVSFYPLEAALGDVIRYFYAGTLPRALQELKQDASLEAKAAKDEVRVLQGITPSSIATQAQRDLSVLARGTLKDLQRVASKDPDPAKRTAALAKLQKIVGLIKSDTTITDELNKNTTLKDLLGELVKPTNQNDGAKLADLIDELRFESTGILKMGLLDKIDQYIFESGKP
jgi:hypothetical protein